MPTPWLRTLACVALAAAVYQSVAGADALRAGLALFTLIGALWMTQALHLSVTALLVPLLAVAAGLMGMREALASFAHPIIFLFLGGFALAAALQRQGLDRALAHAVLRLAAGHRARAVALLFGLTALLSMWISNTATAAMVLPMALGLLRDGEEHEADTPGGIGPRERMFVLLGVAYSASIGGIGTLVGSPPNAIAAAQAGIGFAEWMRLGIPMVALLMPLMVGVLYLVLRPSLGGRMVLVPETFEWTTARRTTLVIFALTAAGWIGSAPLGQALGITADLDSWIAIAALVALVASRTLDWDTLERQTHWGVLLLFGGGLALSQVMQVSGASAFMAGALVSVVQGASALWLLLGVIAFVVFLTELVSNTASAALLIPIFLGVGPALGLSGPLLAAAIAVGASCAFMLPVATPPNAIVFATNLVPQATMMRCGLVLNVVCIGAIALVAEGVF
ncbi:MAG: DASS family sodium-coupled anion symporter [Hydrogenophaga sp.]|uniref:SLC13 family permease n=1 Tax=Hydrogenophaga sp. TaxID=1904254 RepID=UPI002722991A|nr:DASS family sodium-coupled anion symporter [Hydrogenophaga sp.]MDO9482823.1 DASS family sodium-coupled anion symporter [Hydrogenophaga sp.]MDP2220807.1 DASS family sodium-coupled anion symporter [Hydrogenophaga sp.]MDP3347060.1 DASS family sodium-coupled anion symporter [Hydrogenophaga sp.]MDP3806461.1 DASS family sodium-coupled anion symporter [Hydrogenophaga sp.]MDP3925566.1 DASS family sodium-coupled anion symporter [Hydrogenophaga sp.]